VAADVVGEAGRAGVVAHLHRQADACEGLGSPFYAIVLRALAADASADGITARLLREHSEDLHDTAVGLRLLGGVHRLVLSGSAPAVARHYPSAGGDGHAAAAVAPILVLMANQEAAIRDALQRAPQTNEVGRAATLVGALYHLVAARPLQVRLVEIGASAGLNLRCDRFEIQTVDGVSYGWLGSPTVLERAWRGRLPPPTQPVEIVERLGCDPYPLDPTTADGALTLTSYVWPDQPERLVRLRGALAVARQVPATVERAGAAQFLDQVEPRPGTWMVAWHSVMWQYLATAEQQAVLQRLDQIGAGATPGAPLAHVAFEPAADGEEFLVTVQTWPDVGLGSGVRVLGQAPPHGIPVDWV